MSVERLSPCKVNLCLNVLGPRPDGYHNLETLMHPLALSDRLECERTGTRVVLTCTRSDLPVDSSNLVVRAANAFRDEAGLTDGIRMHLDKQVPMAAGLGGGSGNAAAALLALNELFGFPLSPQQLARLAAQLGSDVHFFLQSKPALATGRGEIIEPLDWFQALEGAWMLLVHPGFGISTAWAYQSLERFPEALHGQPGRAQRFVESLQSRTLDEASADFYNSFEGPVFEKHPILALYKEFLRESGANAALMSGSGSAVFALTTSQEAARALRDRFLARFGTSPWTEMLPVGPSCL